MNKYHIFRITKCRIKCGKIKYGKNRLIIHAITSLLMILKVSLGVLD